jgi:hypothetical protein
MGFAISVLIGALFSNYSCEINVTTNVNPYTISHLTTALYLSTLTINMWSYAGLFRSARKHIANPVSSQRASNGG